jgi:glucosamine kinase
MTEHQKKPFVVGVDGGGTGCRALLLTMEEGEVGEAQGPPALIDPSNPGLAAEAIGETVRRAADAASRLLPARALWAGLAGAGRAGEREAVEIALRSMGLAEVVKIGMDVEGAHRDAFQGGPGVLLVVGTGSMAWGRDPEGRTFRVGGWGGVLGDEGSGYWLGLQALRAVAQGVDGRGGKTVLARLILEALPVQTPEGLIPWAAEAGKGQIAALAPLVLKAEGEGDPPAAGIVRRALEELRLHLVQCRERWLASNESFPVALVGGLTREGEGLRPRLEVMVEEVGGSLCDHPVIPVRGAALMAMALL